MSALPKYTEFYTYADYLTWPAEYRYELIDGEAFQMMAAPSTQHQSISMALSIIIGSYLKGKPCRIFSAPFDVRLTDETNPTDDEIVHVIQPDLSVICDPQKIDQRGCLGVPDWIIEILSPSTAQHDLKRKFNLYQTFAVPEYWVVYPGEQIVQVFILQARKYQLQGSYVRSDLVKVGLFKDLTVDLKEVFTELI